MGRLEKAGLYAQEALAAAQRYGDLPMEAQLQLELAEVEFSQNPDGPGCRNLRELLSSLRLRASRMHMRPLEEKAEQLADRLFASCEDEVRRQMALSPREQEVFRLVGEGLSNRAIAEQLHLSQNTVSNHVKSVLRKTGAANRFAAYALARQKRML
jgi:DNA-binding CsgD family transcriptional regulator